MSTKSRLEPWDELSEKNLKKVNALTDAMHTASNSMEVNLATDPIKIQGQNWACVSFVSPDSNQKCKSIGMKIRGVFDQQAEAVDYVKRLIKLDPTFDIFVCDMYNWCLVPPDPEQIGNQTYQDETLNTIISEYRKNQIYAKEHFEERKREMLEQAADEAKQAVLKRMEDESKRELEEVIDAVEEVTIEPQGIMAPSSMMWGDITEDDPVSASEIMESMVNGCKKE